MPDPLIEVVLPTAHRICGCGHYGAHHEEPVGEVDGEVLGPCLHEGCDCKGLINIAPHDVEEIE